MLLEENYTFVSQTLYYSIDFIFCHDKLTFSCYNYLISPQGPRGVLQMCHTTFTRAPKIL